MRVWAEPPILPSERAMCKGCRKGTASPYIAPWLPVSLTRQLHTVAQRPLAPLARVAGWPSGQRPLCFRVSFIPERSIRVTDHSPPCIKVMFKTEKENSELQGLVSFKERHLEMTHCLPSPGLSYLLFKSEGLTLLSREAVSVWTLSSPRGCDSVITGPAGAAVTGLQFLRPGFRLNVVRWGLQPSSLPLPSAAPLVAWHVGHGPCTPS